MPTTGPSEVTVLVTRGLMKSRLINRRRRQRTVDYEWLGLQDIRSAPVASAVVTPTLRYDIDMDIHICVDTYIYMSYLKVRQRYCICIHIYIYYQEKLRDSH